MLIGYYMGYTTHERAIKAESIPNHPVFIWNDDLESIPMDNSTIKLEFTQNDTIYIGPSY